MVTLGIYHWAYLLIVAILILLMILKKDIIVPCILGVFLIGLIYGNWDIAFGLQSIFMAMLTSGKELFDIILVISLMYAMSRAISLIGADRIMISPAVKLIKKPGLAFWVIAAVMYISSIFFWPTPATALVGIVLVPIAVKAGLRPLMAAGSLNIAGHGMALSQDIVIQGAPGLSAAAAGVSISSVMFYSSIFSFVVGITALCSAFIMNRKSLTIHSDEYPIYFSQVKEEKPSSPYAKYFAIGVPIVFMIIIIRSIIGGLNLGFDMLIGGDATALLGGTATIIVIAALLANNRHNFWNESMNILSEGFKFTIRIFAPIIPISAFFMLGSPNHVESILGQYAPGFLFDIGTVAANVLPLSPIPIVIGIVIISVITGFDGSGFSGLPLIGSLAAALAMPAGLNIEILVALGQVITIFTGGGVLVAWAAAPAAGVCGVSATDIIRKNFLPVMIGFGIAVILAIILLYL